jgi:superfamily II DNA or RNA helicase
MVLDKVRHERQQLARKIWIANACKGVHAYPTGFGKTLVLIETVQDMNSRHPDRTTIVIVPNTNLKEDWEGYHITDEQGKKVWIEGHIEKNKLLNVRVFVINTYIKYIDWTCDLLLVDEIHRILNEDSLHFSKVLDITKYRFFMGMSATLTKKQEEFLATRNLKIIDRITQEEAIRNGWIAPSNTFNLAVKLKQKDVDRNKEVNDKFRSYFSKLGHEFDYVKACNGRNSVPITVKLKNGTYLGAKTPEQWRHHIATQNGWRPGVHDHDYTPEKIAKYAAQAMFYMRLRKTVLQNYDSKLEVAEEIIKKYPDKKILVFCETSQFADKLFEKVKNTAVVYHTNLSSIAVKGEEVIEITSQEEKTKLKEAGYKIIGKAKRKEEAKNEFNTSTTKNQLITVRALDEGADFKQVDMIIFLAYNSTQRQRIQREGRGLRIEQLNPNKRALIVFLYIEGTQEEKWLNEAQRGKLGVRWIKSIEEITLNTIKLGSDGADKGTISASEIRIVSGHNTEPIRFTQ